jgi:hypothetical protein
MWKKPPDIQPPAIPQAQHRDKPKDTAMDMRVKEKQKLVMVGNGMAGVRTLEELLKIAPGCTTSPCSAPSRIPTTTASCCRRCWPASRRWTRSC